MFPCYTANKHMRLLTRVYGMYVYVYVYLSVCLSIRMCVYVHTYVRTLA